MDNQVHILSKVKYNILLLSDDSLFSATLKDCLEQSGYKTEENPRNLPLNLSKKIIVVNGKSSKERLSQIFNRIKSSQSFLLEIDGSEFKNYPNYLTFFKPLSLASLIESINEIANQSEQLIELKTHLIDLRRRIITPTEATILKKDQIWLTELETKIIAYLYNKKCLTDDATSKIELLNKVWHYKNTDQKTVVDTVLFKLKRKLAQINLENLVEDKGNGDYNFNQTLLKYF